MGGVRDRGFSRIFFETHSFFDPLLLDTRFQNRREGGWQERRILAKFVRNSLISWSPSPGHEIPKSRGEQERMIFQKFFNKCFRNSLNFLLLFPGHEIPKSMGRGRDGGFSRIFFETYSFFDPLLLDTRFQSRGRSRPSVGTEDFREFFRNSFIFWSPWIFENFFGKFFAKLTHFWTSFSWTWDSTRMANLL